MKPSLFLPALLLAALPTALPAAPGTVHDLVEKIAHGNGVTLADGDTFGGSCTVIGDLDGDGVPEVAIGASSDDTGGSAAGAVHLLFLNADGTVKSTTKIAHGSGGLSLANDDRFGFSCAAIGDLNRDGIPDLAVGAVGDDTGGPSRGALYVLFLASSGSVTSVSKIAHGSGGLSLADNDIFGSSCSAVGDFDGDGVTELAVGAAGDSTGGVTRGALHLIYLNADGSVKSLAKIADGSGGLALLDFGGFGTSSTVLGDLDGDGVPELAVGASADGTGGSSRGAVFILFPNADGSVKTAVKIAHGSGGLSLANFDSFGASCTSPGDLDGDGVPEIAVGANGDSTGGGFRGAVHLIFLNPNGTVKSLAKITDGSGGLALADFDFFGQSCATLGDLDGDGIIELAVGALGDDTGGNDRGAVFLLELGDPPLTVTTLADEDDSPVGPQLSLREAMRVADTANEFRTIRFDPALVGGTIELQGALSAETQSLRITGEDLPDGLTLRMTAGFRVFTLIDADLSLDSLTVSDGFTNGQGAAGFRVDGNSSLTLHRVTVANCVDETSTGGGIFNQGRLVVTDCTFVGNRSDSGGAILNSGASSTLSVLNSTFSDNGTPNALGGAILSAQPMVIRHCTFVGNTADDGGAIASFGACTLSNSLFAGNTAATDPDFDANDVTDGGGNAQVALSELMPLADYGGPTQTQPLKPTSSSKSTASFAPLPTSDQRGEGFPRTVGTGRDPGAVEGTELSDFQPDNRIGLTAAKQIGNNVYNASGQGQTVKLTLSGRKKTSSFFTAENDGLFTDGLRLRSVAPKKKTLKGKVFRLTGGRSNVSAQVFATGLALGDLNPGATVAFQADWSRKSATLKAKQTIQITTSSDIALKSDIVGAKIGSK